jgi:acid stress-induced BolA-like protein IbaG/YrbA
MPAVQDPLVERIRQILKATFRDDTVDVSLSGIRDNIHVIVVSRAFDQMQENAKQEHLWSLIDQSNLTAEEKARISLILAYSPDDLK